LWPVRTLRAVTRRRRRLMSSKRVAWRYRVSSEGRMTACMRNVRSENRKAGQGECVDLWPATHMVRLVSRKLAIRARSRMACLYKILISRRGSRGLNIMTSLYVNLWQLCFLHYTVVSSFLRSYHIARSLHRRRDPEVEAWKQCLANDLIRLSMLGIFKQHAQNMLIVILCFDVSSCPSQVDDIVKGSAM